MRLNGLALLLPILATLLLTGCKSATVAESDMTESVPVLETAQAGAKARKIVSPDAIPDLGEAPEPFIGDAAQAQTASLEEAVNRPTAIKAGQASIFSANTGTDDPAAAQNIPRGENGSVLAASAYARMQGINPLLYSVYGRPASTANQQPAATETSPDL